MAKAGRRTLYATGVLVLAVATLEVGTRVLGAPKGERSRRGDFYELAAAELAGSPEFIDASAVLNGNSGDVFHDLGYVSAFGVPVVDEFIATTMLERLKDDAIPASAPTGQMPMVRDQP